MDVLEIDAATHTGVDNIREVIVSGLAIRPVRDRYKIFIIDEVHQLSNHSFNALLKSIEEPPPHVVFMMATTELHKVPDTIRSRSQEFEFRTIGTRAIADQLRKIAETDGIDVEPAALQLIARAAEGSLRDAESAFDQVIAFAGGRISAEDAATVLGVVGRDFLLDVVATVADEDAARVFDVAGRAVEAGLDLRLVCRELSRLVRDMMVVAIDPERLEEPDLAPDGDLERLAALARRFSREDLLRAFDILSKAEFEIRTSPQPRYHFEMALLKWIYARKMVPVAALLQGAERGAASSGSSGMRPPVPPSSSPRPQGGVIPGAGVRRIGAELAARRAAPPVSDPTPAVHTSDTAPAPASREPSPEPPAADAAEPDSPRLKDAIVEEIRKGNRLLHGTAVAQALKIELSGDTLVFTFGTNQRTLRQQLEQKRASVEAAALQAARRKIQVITREEEVTAASAGSPVDADLARERLRQRALEQPAVQAVLDVFPAEIRDVEEVEN
jgi:DNA polymerase-3 subunit gamma/tau